MLVTALLCCLTAAVVFAGGEQEQEAVSAEQAAAPGPYGAYDPPIVVDTWRGEYNRTWPEGQSNTDNVWTRAIEERLGIKFNYVWTAPGNEMNSKINVAIASGDLPDIFRIPYNPYYNLARSGQLEPMEEVINEYAVAQIKENLFTVNDGLSAKVLSYDGVLYGMGKAVNPLNGAFFIWSRDDWRQAVGMPDTPETWDEFMELARRFAKDDPDGDGKDDTVGLGMHQNLFGAIFPFEGYFAAHGAYPTIWVERDGELVHGATTRENIDALRELAELYDQGILDKEWVIKHPWRDANGDVAAEKIGLVVGRFWWCDLAQVGQVVETNLNATWSPALIPSVEGGLAKTPNSIGINNATAVRKGFQYPEAIVKIANLGWKVKGNRETAEGQFSKVRGADGKFINTFRGMSDFFALGYNKVADFSISDQVREAIANRDPSGLDPESKIYFDNAMGYLDGSNPTGYRSLGTFGPGGGTAAQKEWYNRGLYLWDNFYGPNTATMNTALGDLNSKRLEYFTKIIVGDLDVERGFEDWVDYWNVNGGELITAEVNEWYAAQ
jgi:putative aldouronate transport system substrate-binding protein